METPGNHWGDPCFRDDPKLADSPVSSKGKEQIQRLHDNLEDNHKDFLKDVDLVIVSPLTRTLQTMDGGLQGLLPEGTRILAQPLCRERVYTASDCGRLASTLEKEYPSVDFSETGPGVWWFDGCGDDEDYQEWRPCDHEQWYAVQGEPAAIFYQRMKDFREWLMARPEQRVVLVGHQAVLLSLTGSKFENCECRVWKV